MPLFSKIAQAAANGCDQACDLVFAPQCAACAAALEVCSSPRLCHACRRVLCEREVPRCQRCGQIAPIEGVDLASCPRCEAARLRFERCWLLGGYRGELRRAVLRLKYPGEEALAITLAELWWQTHAAEVGAESFDVVAPIPMHWRRRWLRGVNNPELLAEVLARKLKIPLARRLLVRRRNTLPQADLLPSQRARNVRGAFRLGMGYALQAARVLLVDDILTTGATCNAAAKLLKKRGAAAVAVAVLARAELT